MRIRKDATSWHASGVIKRDARNDKSARDVPKPVRGKKDRKRWCGGHEGREHRLEAMKKSLGIVDYWVHACAVCGREMDRYYKFSFMKDKRPDWMPEGES